MTIKLTFVDVCKSLRDEYPEITEDLNNFSNLILTLCVAAAAAPIAEVAGVTSTTPLAIGLSTMGTLANLFGVKNEIPRIATSILNKVTSKRENDPLAHLKKLERAYYLLCFTAFFEALGQDKQLAPLMKKARVTQEEKLGIATKSAQELWQTTSQTNVYTSDSNELALLNFKLELPHPTATFAEQTQQLQPLYEYLTQGTEKFLMQLAVWDEMSEQNRTITQKSLKNLPTKAHEYFKAQYYLLAAKYQEFYVWSNLQEQKEIREELQSTSDFIQKYVAMVEASKEAIDSGFKNLATAINLLPHYFEQTEINNVIIALERKYKRFLEKPIIDNEGQESISDLTYPTREQIFIPQKCEVVRYTGKEQLEQYATWEKARKFENVGVFLLSYLSSPYSTRTPLIILGDPGSGKSLLTSMIAARWASTTFTPIRIPLRNVNAGARIQRQIEEQLNIDTSEEVRWGQLARHLQERPALLLFDGYDELLQATGQVFSDYLQTVCRFQDDELDQERPTRAIVTSRRTLISKADIPIGATIIRLLDFDEEKQQCWIDIWNTANAAYFQQKKIRSFKVPNGNEKIKELAKQPLLLLMLALYDTEGNQLHKTRNIDRTLLYHQLLQRFIVREQEKDPDFASLPEKERKEEIKKEMERLGVTAIGMFNRRALYIQETQLSLDLQFFGKQRTLSSGPKAQLSQGSALLGSFFFVQKAETGLKTTQIQEQSHNFAYEFLHNTFGEFLTADFMLYQILQETSALYSMRSSEYLQAEYWQKLDNFTRFSPHWFACLMYAPLFSRPVIVTMLREWLKHTLKEKRIVEQSFLQDLEAIICHHIKLLLEKNTLPTIMNERDKYSPPDLPILGYIAIYTLNLILLGTLFSQEDFVFDEERFSATVDDTRPWDQLVYLWRSWFSLDTLGELATIFTAERDKNKIRLRIKDKSATYPSRDRLDLVYTVSNALADNIVTGLSGIISYDSYPGSRINHQIDLDIIGKKLLSEQINLSAGLLTKKLRYINNNQEISEEQLRDLLEKVGIRRMFWYKIDDIEDFANEIYRLGMSLDSKVALLFLRNISRDLPNYPPINYFRLNEHFLYVKEILEDYDQIREMGEKLIKEAKSEKNYKMNLRAMDTIIKIIRDTGSWYSTEAFEPSFSKHIQHRNHVPAPSAIAMISLAHEVGDQKLLSLFNQTYLPTMLHLEKHISVDLAIELVKLGRVLGNQNVLDHFKGYLIDKLINQGSVSDALVVEVLKFAYEVDNHQDIASFFRQYVANIITKDIRVSVSLTVALIKLAREVIDRQLIDHIKTYLHKIIERQKSVPLELATEMIKFARQFNIDAILQYFNEQYLRDAFQSERLFPVDITVELIKVALEAHYDQTIIMNFYYRNITKERCHTSLLPLDTIATLHHLTREFGDNQLAEMIEQRLK